MPAMAFASVPTQSLTMSPFPPTPIPEVDKDSVAFGLPNPPVYHEKEKATSSAEQYLAMGPPAPTPVCDENGVNCTAIDKDGKDWCTAYEHCK